MPCLQRKYIDLIRHVSSKWVNWDPPIPIEVGSYGDIENDTGDLRVHGNIYDPEFQRELDKLALASPICLADHPPQQGSVEDDYFVLSKGAKRLDLHLGPEVGIAGIANASIKGQWQFEHGKRDALLIMHRPRQTFLPRHVILDTLYRVPKLRDKWLVTNVHVCPAFSMYLSNKSGETVSLALVAQAPIAAAAGATAGADGGIGWHTDAQADLVRKACDKQGNYVYTPLYTLKRRTKWTWSMSRAARNSYADSADSEEEPQGDDLWVDAVSAPWDPLDEDGEEVSLFMQPDDLTLAKDQTLEGNVEEPGAIVLVEEDTLTVQPDDLALGKDQILERNVEDPGVIVLLEEVD